MRVTERDVAFFADELARSECAATKRYYLRLAQPALFTPDDPLCLRVDACHASAPAAVTATHAHPSSLSPSSAGAVATTTTTTTSTSTTTVHVSWTLDKALVAARVVALDARTLWECAGPRLLHTLAMPHDTWNEQLAVKLLHRFLMQRKRHRRDDDSGDDDDDERDNTATATSRALTLATLAEHAATHIKPACTSSSLSLSKATMCNNSNSNSNSSNHHHSDNDDDDSHRRDDVVVADGGDGAMACDAVAVATASWAARDARATRESALLCRRPLPAFAPLLRVPRRALLCVATLRRYCAFARAVAASPTLRACGIDDEALLVLCLVYERDVVGRDASHWRALLRHCPDAYPHMPVFWPARALAELEGTDVVDEVVRKRQQVEQFCVDVRELLLRASLAVSSTAQSHEDGGGDDDDGEAAMDATHRGTTATTTTTTTTTTMSALHELLRVLTPQAVLWAHATVDSRAFQLRMDATDALVLVPIADMLNHSNRTDVLVRRVLPSRRRRRQRQACTACDKDDGDGEQHGSDDALRDADACSTVADDDDDDDDGSDDDSSGSSSDTDDGEFVACIGAALTADDDVGRELWMCYGPLQNWELLLYYGFVLDDNEHDKLPFPLDMRAVTAVTAPPPPCNDDDSDKNDDDDDDDNDARRRALVAQYALLLAGQCWLARDGVPCDALLALLRVQLATAAELTAMMTTTTTTTMCGDGPFAAQSTRTEVAVVDAVATAVCGVLSLFSTTLAADEAALRDNNGDDDDNHDDDDGDHDDEEEAVTEDSDDNAATAAAIQRANVRLAIRLRVGLKQIAHHALAWCRQRRAALLVTAAT